MTGRRVLATLGCILLATAVLPPGAAWWVNRSRVRLASDEVTAVAETLRHVEPQLRDMARNADVLCGPGRVPLAQALDARPWAAAPRAALVGVVGDRRSLSADPWGNCYVVNLAAVAASEPAALWVLSAGPNGVIETPFLAPPDQPLVGDDVGARIR
jgi:hypothetical protein